MTKAGTIAANATDATEAAAAIKALLAIETPDLVSDSGPWQTQADLLAGAVAVCWRNQGRAGNSAAAIRRALGL